MNIWGWILKSCGWTVDITAPRRKKCVICVAPHTSNLDFFIGIAAYKSLGREANFLMKKFWFFFPLGNILKKIGGIPICRNKGMNQTVAIIQRAIEADYINLAITPEGTRSLNDRWKTGFLYIAQGANLPIQLGVIDYKNKIVTISDEFFTSGNIENDMKYVKQYYANKKDGAKYPEKFTTKA
jgi:1-acyl-sn-glycerol-3-phosphate acyltransferase